ncbi:MAG: opacity protein-like surface antigen [Bacteroidia bacterium]|jgi:opacity protein-like surface antigen
MKKLTPLFTLLLLSQLSFGQLKFSEMRVNIGFGIQQYNGDLGNGFYDFSKTTYGVGVADISIPINKSFDLMFMTTLGDLGYCQPEWKKELFESNADEHNHVHGKKPEEENLNSRMTSAMLGVQYKFANNYLLKSYSKWAPYVYAAAGINRLTDFMKMECVDPGMYSTINWGAGCQYQLMPNCSVGLKFSFGSFNNDGLDFIRNSSRDMYMQNSFMLGFAI